MASHSSADVEKGNAENQTAIGYVECKSISSVTSIPM